VEREAKFQPDFIKVWFIQKSGVRLAEQERIVAAAGEAARAAGIRLAVHATELAVAKAALRAGADYLVHSVEDAPLDEEFLELARARNVLYCPTLSVYDGYGDVWSGEWRASAVEARRGDPEIVNMLGNAEALPRELFPEEMSIIVLRQHFARRAPIMAANLRRAHEAGLTIVMGTDAGNIGTLHGPAIHREMAMMVQAGLTPMQIIQSATVNGARALGMEKELGTLAPGMLADLIVLDADPLEDIANLARVHRVVKDGVVFDPEELMQSVSERP
jgi:imidazolonepropionase-like amidohydrolase